MDDLLHVKGKTYYLKGSTNIGIIVNDKGQCILIDSGLDEVYGKRILKIMNNNNWTLKAIINTHSHADHCGGNAFLQKRTDARVYASSFEGAIMENPLLEPYYLYSASPIKELEVKFLLSKPTADVNILREGMNDLEGTMLKIVPLPGHSREQIGVVTTDGVFFVADSLFPRQVWDKYKIPYFENIKASLETLDKLKEISNNICIVSHYGRIDEIQKMASYNVIQIKKLLEIIMDILRNPTSREDLIKILVNTLSIGLSIMQYFLLSSTISAYIAYLSREGFITPIFHDGKLFWRVK